MCTHLHVVLPNLHCTMQLESVLQQDCRTVFHKYKFCPRFCRCPFRHEVVSSDNNQSNFTWVNYHIIGITRTTKDSIYYLRYSGRLVKYSGNDFSQWETQLLLEPLRTLIKRHFCWSIHCILEIVISIAITSSRTMRNNGWLDIISPGTFSAHYIGS